MTDTVFEPQYGAPQTPTNPLVSVCVQTYNHEPYIAECLDGILSQQTEFDIEVIVGEDHSEDNTRAICQQYADAHPDKIRLFLRRRDDVIRINNVPSGRFNFLSNTTAARGKYLAICEGDDVWTDPSKLQTQVDFLEANADYAICFHNAVVQWEDRDKRYLFRKNGWYKESYIAEEIIGWHFMPTASLVLKRPQGFEFPGWFRYVASGDIALTSIFSEFGKAKYLDKPMSIYRKHQGGISRTRKGWNYFLLRAVLLFHLDAHFGHQYHTVIRRRQMELLRTFLYYETRSGRIFGHYAAMVRRGWQKLRSRVR